MSNSSRTNNDILFFSSSSLILFSLLLSYLCLSDKCDKNLHFSFFLLRSLSSSAQSSAVESQAVEQTRRNDRHKKGKILLLNISSAHRHAFSPMSFHMRLNKSISFMHHTSLHIVEQSFSRTNLVQTSFSTCSSQREEDKP